MDSHQSICKNINKIKRIPVGQDNPQVRLTLTRQGPQKFNPFLHEIMPSVTKQKIKKITGGTPYKQQFLFF